MVIYVIRHGMPDYSTGLLTEEGREQAEKLGKRLSNVPIDKMYVSTIHRAEETASYILKHHPEIAPIKCDWAREDIGAKYFFEHFGKNKYDWYFMRPKWQKYFRQEKLLKLGNSWIKDPKIKKTLMPDGYKEMAKSVDDFLLENGYKHDRKKHQYIKVGETPKSIMIVAHGGFGVSFISNLLDIPYPEFVMTHVPMGVASISIIDITGDVAYAMLATYNDISHYKQ